MRHHKFGLIAASAVSASALALGPALLSAQASTVGQDRHPGHRGRRVRQGQRTGTRPGRRDHRLRGQQATAERALHGRGRPKPSVVVAGSNDYCTVELAGGTWAGFYRSTDSGASWIDSLLPGYPTDTSPEGLASPLQQRGITNAGDPVQAWDLQGRLFYMGNAFNRVAPQNGSVWVATYDQDAAHYVRTVIVGKAGPALNGRFNDKTSIEVDRGVNSPLSGQRVRRVEPLPGHQRQQLDPVRPLHRPRRDVQPPGEDLHRFQGRAVRRHRGDQQRHRVRRLPPVRVQPRAPGGLDPVRRLHRRRGDFSKPATAAEFEPFDAADSAGDPEAAEEAHEQAFQNADGPESEAGEESVGDSRDCGSGPFACQSGFVFFRHDSQPRITADPKVDRARTCTWSMTRPSPAPSRPRRPRTTPPTRRDDAARRSGRRSTSPPSPVAPGPRPGCSLPRRAATSSSPTSTPTAESCTRCGTTAATTRPTASSTRPATTARSETPPASRRRPHGLDTYAASSTNGGTSWALARLSGASQMPNYEMFGDRRVPVPRRLQLRLLGGIVRLQHLDRHPTGRRPETTRATPAVKDSTSCSAAPRTPPAPGRPTPAPTPAASTRTSTAPPPPAEPRTLRCVADPARVREHRRVSHRAVQPKR